MFSDYASICIVAREPFFRAEIETLVSRLAPNLKVNALLENIRNQFSKLVENSPILPRETQVAAQNIDDPGMLADFVATNLNLKLEDMEDVLETIDINQDGDNEYRRITVFTEDQETFQVQVFIYSAEHVDVVGAATLLGDPDKYRPRARVSTLITR